MKISDLAERFGSSVFESVMNALADGIIVIDRDLTVLFQNRIIEAGFGSRTGEKCYKAFRGLDRPCQNCNILDVIKDAASGERAQISELSAGDSIGEMAVVDNFPRSATVVAKTPATLLTMTSTDFNQLLKDHPEVGITILKAIARILSINLRKTSSQLADYMLPVM